MKKISILMAALVGMLATACNNNNPETPQETVETPITITAHYGKSGSANAQTRISYSESGNTISAKWESGDKLKVVYNGSVSTLDLNEGAGTTRATFSGTISGSPSATSMLICYVCDQNNTSAVTVNTDGSYTYTDGTFLAQDGTLAGAAKCNLYYGTTFYGTGSDISCYFAVNTSMMKFTVWAPDGVSEGDEATLTYKSAGTAISKATFTVGASGHNTIYLTIPAGQYTGEQTLVYNSGATENSETLSATKANFAAGETYSKTLYYYGDSGIPIADLGTNSEYIGYVLAANGRAYTSVSDANTYSIASAMIAYLGNRNGGNGLSAYSSAYNHGLAIALNDIEGGRNTWNGMRGAASSCTIARPDASSGWALPTAYQWMRMLEACGGGKFNTIIYNNGAFSYGNFKTKLSDCGGTAVLDEHYWTKTDEGGENAWAYSFYHSWFTDQSYYSYHYGRPVFAF